MKLGLKEVHLEATNVVVDVDAICQVIRSMTQAASRQVMQSVTNKIVSRSLPNNNRSGDKPRKQNLKALRDRIKQQLTNDGNPLTAPPNDNGTPIMSKATGESTMPVLVIKSFRGRPRKGRKLCKPDRVLGVAALQQHVLNSTLIKAKKGVAVRVKKQGSKLAWTTKATLNQLVREIQKRAGFNIYGWTALADKVASNAVKNSMSAGQSFSSPGSASISPATMTRIDRLNFKASNPNSPREETGYQQRCIDKYMPRWVETAIKRELKFLTASRLRKAANIPLDCVIKMM